MLGTNSLQLVPAMRSMNLDNGDDDDDRCSACHGTGLRLRHRSRARGGASTTRRVQKTSPPQQSATASAVSQIPVPTGNKSCLNGQTTNVQKKAILVRTFGWRATVIDRLIVGSFFYLFILFSFVLFFSMDHFHHRLLITNDHSILIYSITKTLTND